MTSPRLVAVGGRKRDRALYSVTREAAVIVSNVRRFFERKCRRGRSIALGRPIERTRLATGLSESTVQRVNDEAYASSRRRGRDPERRQSSRRVPSEELARVREAVYKQYENRSIPTLSSTLLYLTAERAAGQSNGTYKWTRTTLFRCMQDLGFTFARGPNHYDIAREKPSTVAQRNEFLRRVQEYREAGRTIFYTDETWASKNMTPSRTWNDGNLRARLNVPSGKGGRIIIAHVGSRSTGLVKDAALVFIGKKKTGDYHGEMNSQVWLKWLQDSVLPKMKGGVLVVDRAPYHMVLTDDTRPASSKLRKAELADWLEAYDAVSREWEADWRQ
eukprot:contig_12710_g3034